jgi:hypothetical protein
LSKYTLGQATNSLVVTAHEKRAVRITRWFSANLQRGGAKCPKNKDTRRKDTIGFPSENMRRQDTAIAPLSATDESTASEFQEHRQASQN